MRNAVLFDIDDTLYSYINADAVALPALADWAEGKLGVAPEQFVPLYWEAFREQTRRIGRECGASHSRMLRCVILLEWLRQPLTLAREMERVYWDTLLRHMEPTPGIGQCLAALKERGLRLGIGTDLTVGIQLEKLEKLGLLHWFDFLVTSEEAGEDKPAPRFFALCLQKAGCRPEECLFVGDNPRRDVAGANAAGMTGVWYQPDENKAAEHPELLRITHMEELLTLL